MSPVLRRMTTWLAAAVAFGLIGAAVLLTLLRLALPFAGDYRAQIEQRVSAYLNAPVSIGAIDIEWHGLGPRLRLQDLSLGGTGPLAQPVHFDSAFVDLGLGAGAAELPFRIRSMSLVGIDLEARVDSGGRLSLLGFTLDPGRLASGPDAGGSGAESDALPPAARAVVNWLVSADRLQLLDARVTVVGPDGDSTAIPGLDLRLVNSAGRHRLSAQAALPEAYGDRLQVIVDMQGNPLSYADTHGTLYANGSGLAVGAWQALWPGTLELEAGGTLDGAAWIDWRDGRIGEIQADADLRSMTLAGGDDRAVQFDRLGGRFAWRATPDGWVLDADRVVVDRDGSEWPAGAFSVAHGHGPRGNSWRGRFDSVRLQDVAAVARVLGPGDPRAARMLAAAPRGDLHDLAFSLRGADAFALRARLDDVGWSPVDRLPGLAGLDGRMDLTAAGGTVMLDTNAARLRSPALFSDELAIRRAQGRIRIERDGGTVRVHAPHLQLANDDIGADARLDLRLPAGAAPQMDMQVDFGAVDIAAVPRYLPTGIMKDDLVDWLHMALRSGRVRQGTVLFRGPVTDFPFRGHEGVFDVGLDVGGAEVRYAPEWPALTGFDGRVHFHGAGLDVVGEQAGMYGAQVRRVHARIADFDDALLRIDGNIRSSMPDVIRLMNETPLRERMGAFFDGASGGGTADVDLGLEIPLQHADDTHVEGRATLNGARLVQPRFDLDFDDLRGTLRFTDEGLWTDGTRARVRGRPVSIDATTRLEHDPAIVFSVDGRLGARDLLPGLDAGLAERLQGRSPWHLDIAVPVGAQAAGRPVQLRGESDLQGLAVTVPAPLAKPADDARHLEFSLPLRVDASRHRARIDYGPDSAIVLEVAGRGDDLRVTRGTIHFGPGEAALHAGGGIHLGGSLERVPLGPWLDVIFAGGHDGGHGAAGDDAGPAFGGADLKIRRLDFRGRTLSDLTFRTSRDEAGWHIVVDCNELSGRIGIPAAGHASGGPVTAAFDWIDFALLKPPAGRPEAAAGDTSAVAALRPADLPPLDLRVGRLKLAHGTLHDVALVTAPAGNGLTIHRLQFDNPHLSLSGQGRWSAGASGQRTSLRFTLQGDDFGTGLAPFGYGQAIEGGSGQVRGELRWQGAPWDVALGDIEGYVDLRVEDGVIRDLDVGPARLLGLFSLRRAALDLKGLLSSGFPFGHIKGRIDLADGNAYTRDLTVKGPAGRIRVEGRTGLVAEDYDQTIRFKPELGTSLPVLGALSGGPATGVAIAVIQGILRTIGPGVEEASELTYRLTGSWAAPKVDQVKVKPATAPEQSRETPPGGR